MIGRPRKRLLLIRLPVMLDLVSWSSLLDSAKDGPTVKDAREQLRKAFKRQMNKRKEAA